MTLQTIKEEIERELLDTLCGKPYCCGSCSEHLPALKSFISQKIDEVAAEIIKWAKGEKLSVYEDDEEEENWQRSIILIPIRRNEPKSSLMRA